MNSIEKKFVHNTYQKIAKEFSDTRTYIWPSVKLFLDSIEPFSVILEVGCGNGKNLDFRKDCFNLGIDLCSEFCKITKNRNIESVIANNISIPFKSDSVDILLSIAVIHHLSTNENRIRALNEMIRILKPNGKIMIQVWAYEQHKGSRRKFVKGDNYVEFKDKSGNLCEKRYYHIFTEESFQDLLANLRGIIIEKIYLERGNWISILKKSDCNINVFYNIN